MKIQFTTEHGSNPFKCAIVAAALNGHKWVKMAGCFTSFEVDDWSEFMKFAWHAAAECSRDGHGKWIVERVPVSVHLDDGRRFSTFVWYDVESEGLRYVSLY